MTTPLATITQSLTHVAQHDPLVCRLLDGQAVPVENRDFAKLVDTEQATNQLVSVLVYTVRVGGEKLAKSINERDLPPFIGCLHRAFQDIIRTAGEPTEKAISLLNILEELSQDKTAELAGESWGAVRRVYNAVRFIMQ